MVYLEKLYNKLNKYLSHISLKTQLAILIISTFSIVIVAIIVYSNQRNLSTIVNQQTSTISSLLRLETQNIDSYLSEIDRYSLLLRHEESFMQIINNRQPLSYEDALVVQTLLRSNFDSRTDLISYRLYLVKKSMYFEIDAAKHKVQSFIKNDISTLPNYSDFTVGRFYKYLKPTQDPDSFLVFYRTIIDIETQEPLAIVELTFDTSFIRALISDRKDALELFSYVDDKGQLYYTNNDRLINQRYIDHSLPNVKTTSKGTVQTDIDGESYLVVSNTSLKYGYTLYNFKPLAQLDRQISDTRNISLALGFLSITVTTILAILLIRLVTTPLTTLAHQLRDVGSGNFTTPTHVGGSLEITKLAQDFNSMIYQIDDLINKTYKSELNEKTSRLIALEAQLNPHFLYNTLQAISAEAIINHQPKINYMVTALASIMRYTIKGGDFVTLSDELKYVNDYLLLQKARFEDNLSYELSIPEAAKGYFIPKISIQTLVENSIIHGMKGTVDHVHVKILGKIDADTISIIVSDNGCGIDPKKLEQIRNDFNASRTAENRTNHIGLLNLYSRIQLLYSNKASLEIESSVSDSTVVTLTIPIYTEVPTNEQFNANNKL